MDQQFIITPLDLECILYDETAKPVALPLSLLKTITNDFSQEEEVGKGGFAVVYKGMLINRTVAVKRMFMSHLHEKEYQREVECLMNVNHKNIVRFLGYCADTQGSMQKHDGNYVMADVQHRLLCFEYLPKGNLHEYITDTSRELRWRDRYQIIMGICQGLHHLHEKNILHLDLKPANILLDDSWVPKICDFGISRCFDQIQSQDITQISGTRGYLAPESFSNNKVSYLSDIYSLGIVIAEILTGERDHYNVNNVVERWSNMLEKSGSDIQLKQVRVCAEIGVECVNKHPEKRPKAEDIINRLNETETRTDVMTSQQAKHDPNELHQDKPGETISEDEPSFLFRYQQLNPNTRRCIEYCSIFPRGFKLRKDKLVCQWIAQEYVKTISATEDMEDVAEGYIEELLLWSFLQPEKCDSDLIDCFTIHSRVHDFLDNVARKCYRIENKLNQQTWLGYVPGDVQHIFVEKYDAKLITKKIFGLKDLSTLIIEYVPKYPIVEENFIEIICKRLPKLRTLSIDLREEPYPATPCFIPKSISHLKHLRYLAFRTQYHCKITLPSTLNELQHIRLLDFGDCEQLVYHSFADLSTLRHIFYRAGVEFPDISRLTLLRTIPVFTVRNRKGYELKQLRGLNNLHGSLVINGLIHVKSKEEALEANLAAKKRLTGLDLNWWCLDQDSSNAKIEEEVFEGLCPPVGLKYLRISAYSGLMYPDWMVGKQNRGPKDLQHLKLWRCGQPGVPPPQLVEAFPNLRELVLSDCKWDTLPSNMVLLSSLKYLSITECKNIRSLPTLPQSLENICINHCDYELSKTCRQVGHSNWEKIKHIPTIECDYIEWKDEPRAPPRSQFWRKVDRILWSFLDCIYA